MIERRTSDIKSCLNGGLETVEIAVEEFDLLLRELADTYNQLAELARDSAVEKPRELAKMAEDSTKSLLAEKSPIGKILILNAYIRQLIAKLRSSMANRSPTDEHCAVTIVRTKILSRAMQILEYIRGSHFGPSNTFALDSRDARKLIAGKEGEEPSRRDTIRALWKAKKLWPALMIGHRPNDPRGTIRATIKEEDKPLSPVVDVGLSWQRSQRRITLPL